MDESVFRQNFKDLCNKLADVDVTGSFGPEPPWKSGCPILQGLKKWMAPGISALPAAYRRAFLEPLENKLSALIDAYPKSEENQRRLEAFVCAVYQHAPDYPFRSNLHRLLGLVSDLYRSFLEPAEGTAWEATGDKIQVTEALPPLATFKCSGKSGSFIFPVDDVRQRIGGSVAVVSLPAVYAERPILWVWAAHETGGHAVVHAVRGLLDELRYGVQQELAKMSVRGRWPGGLGVLWRAWMNEAVADVYGVLNIGPAYGAALAAAIAAQRRWQANLDIPQISMDSSPGPSGEVDRHPTDILRIHLALGAVESLIDLDREKRQHYAAELRTIADLCKSAEVVSISGYRLYHGRGVNAILPLDEMQEFARRVGRYIATTELKALGGRSIQQIETWDNHDERTAEHVRDALAARAAIGVLGDDAQLFAGAISQLLRTPGDYDHVVWSLKVGLDQSFADDPLWGSAHRATGRSGQGGTAAAAERGPHLKISDQSS